MCIFLGRRAFVCVCVARLSCGGVGRTPLVVPFLAVVGVKGESIRGCPWAGRWGVVHGSRRDRQPTSAAVVDKQVLGVFVVCGPVAWNLDGGPFECKLAVHTLQKQTAK
jgi:hypothetical protein